MGMIELSRFFQSFRHALRGVRLVFLSEQSFRVQVLVAVFALVLLILVPVGVVETSIVLLMIALVLVLEMINSTFERLVDAFKPRLHPVVGEIKDIMAAAVLVASVAAALIGLAIFVPPLLRLI